MHISGDEIKLVVRKIHLEEKEAELSRTDTFNV